MCINNGLLMDSISNPSAINDNKVPSLKLLFAAFIIAGPSVGYIVYKALKNQDKKQEDISYRRDMIFKTAFEALFIFLPLWFLMKAIKFI